MSTFQRRHLKAGPLSATARKLIDAANERQGEVGFPRELLADAGVSEARGWTALAQLLERGLLEKNALGHLKVTSAGRGYRKVA